MPAADPPSAFPDADRADTAGADELDWRQAVSMAGMVLWRHDLISNRVYLNDRGYELLGVAPRHGGLPAPEAAFDLHPDDLAKAVTAGEQAITSQGPVDVELRRRDHNHQWHSMWTRRIVQRDDGGRPIATHGIALDVTEHVQRERDVGELTQTLEDATAASGIGLWRIDVQTGLTQWNAQMHELLRMPDGVSAPPLATWAALHVHPEDRGLLLDFPRAAIEADGRMVQIELRLPHAGPNPTWLLLRGHVRKGPEPVLSGVAIDVSEMHRVLDDMRELTARSLLITRAAGIGTWEVDPHDDVALWDEQMWRLRGLPPRHQGLTLDEALALVHPADREHVRIELDRAATDDNAAEYEFRVPMPDGSFRWLASRSIPVRNEAGRTVRRVGINLDITANRAAEAARQEKVLIEREGAARTKLLARMSHELRTPLNAILGFAQLLLDDNDASAEARQQRAQHIRSSGMHLLALIDNVLELSHPAGASPVTRAGIALHDVVAQALPLVEPLAAQNGVRLVTGRVDGAAWADAGRLKQVLLNLLDHALEQAGTGGGVWIEGCEDAGSAVLTVRASGRSAAPTDIAPDDLASDAFLIDESGIGLGVAQALAVQMEAQLTVTGTPESGSCYELRLPAAAPVTPMAPPGAAPESHTRRLLYIEDNPVNVMLVEELVLRRGDIEFESAPDGETGILRAKALLPDLVLLDIHLPGISGREVLSVLRAEPSTAHIPCIALSANAMPEDIRTALDEGFADYWTKPLDFKAFTQALEATFGPAPR